MTPVEHLLTAPDGRRIAVAERGDPAGAAVIELHGVPGARLGDLLAEDDLVRAGVRLLAYDGPGHGASTRLRGRQVLDAAADVAVISDALGLRRLAVTGGAEGGPHALAAAWGLPRRVAVAECRGGLAPVDAAGLDWSADMDPAQAAEFGWALAGEQRLGAELHAEALADLADAESSAPPSSGAGIEGRVDDDLALVAPWGFDPAEIRVPVLVRWDVHGGVAPAAHGAWLAGRIPTAEPHPEIAESAEPDAAGRVRRLRALADRVRG